MIPCGLLLVGGLRLPGGELELLIDDPAAAVGGLVGLLFPLTLLLLLPGGGLNGQSLSLVSPHSLGERTSVRVRLGTGSPGPADRGPGDVTDVPGPLRLGKATYELIAVELAKRLVEEALPVGRPMEDRSSTADRLIPCIPGLTLSR